MFTVTASIVILTRRCGLSFLYPVGCLKFHVHLMYTVPTLAVTL